MWDFPLKPFRKLPTIKTPKPLSIPPSMNSQGQNTVNKRVVLAKLLAVITKLQHWQRTYSDHCFVERQLRHQTNRLFDGLDASIPLMWSYYPPEPADQLPLNPIDPSLVPLPLEVEENAAIAAPPPPESMSNWDMMSNFTMTFEPCSVANGTDNGSDVSSDEYEIVLSAQTEDDIDYPNLGLQGSHDQVNYPALPLEQTPDRAQDPGLHLGHEEDDNGTWRRQMDFVSKGERMEVWKWLNFRVPVLHPSHISLPLQLDIIRRLENPIAPTSNSLLRDFDDEASYNLVLMTEEIAGLEFLIDKMSRILYELEREDRDPFVEPISIVLFD
ncbi:hypothetical protein B0T21DRAFT_294453 [Apiosordaria backusii]|uniref:Uncharacterized protein n=1 Tax=Apiosordaria backusii TaxID=314023 RepID=A0AA40AXF3_9PEZI|nr:hypothetical protein B0T21DRAFT_294453 [Apiosordaria backusii]